MIHVKNSCFALLAISLLSCQAPRTLYLSNTSGKAVTLWVDPNPVPDLITREAAFKDSLHGKRIERGHVIINFGEGRWTEADKENLKTLLPHIIVVRDGQADSLRLPGNTKIKHYGSFVNELVVKINKFK